MFLFHFKSSFRSWENQILEFFHVSCGHQMPRHKTGNTFYWITWEVNTICQWNLASLCHITKEKISSENFTKTAAWKLVPGPFIFPKNEAYLVLANEIFEASYLY